VPIIVRPSEKEGRSHILVAGLHRKVAMHQLGLVTIRCEVHEYANDDEALLDEIAENLDRGDLDDAQRAAHRAKQKELYERLHPQTRKGRYDRSGTTTAKLAEMPVRPPSYVQHERSGHSTRKIERDIARAGAVPSIAEAAGTSLAKGEELDAARAFAEARSRPSSRRRDEAAGRHVAQPSLEPGNPQCWGRAAAQRDTSSPDGGAKAA
jgi:hypothetical protein